MSPPDGDGGLGAHLDSVAPPPSPLPARPVAIGHREGAFFVITAQGELRRLSGKDLEAGKGVLALVAGNPAALSWARGTFGDGERFSEKALGRALIEEGSRAGLFDPMAAQLRRGGVWRADDGRAVLNAGDAVVASDGETWAPGRVEGGGPVYLAAPATPRPKGPQATPAEGRKLLAALAKAWGWRKPEHAAAFLGWCGGAMLGGFPDWRAHLGITGARGSGKSELAEFAAAFLGPMAGGGVLNGATEAGLRQSRDATACALLLDEFEAEEGKGGSAVEVLGLARRMSGGGGGRVVKGGADHVATGFRMLGAIGLFAIRPPEMNAAERSRFVRIEVGTLPRVDPTVAAKRLAALRQTARQDGRRFWASVFWQAGRWDETAAAFAAAARQLGADAREAATVAFVAAGLDMLTETGAPSAKRVDALRPLLASLLSGEGQPDEPGDGEACLRHLLQSFVRITGSMPRSIADVLRSAVKPELIDTDIRTLANYGLRPDADGVFLHVATRHAQLARIFEETRWAGGGWRDALLGMPGALVEPHPIRAAGQRFRAVRVPLAEVWEPG